MEALEIADQITWTIERELLTASLELLDVIARKGTKVKDPLIKDVRPLSVRRAAAKKKVQSMSDPKVREFFGAGQVKYTPRRDPSEPPDGSEPPSSSTSSPEPDTSQPGPSESLSDESTGSPSSTP